MKFGIVNLSNGWFQWFVRDDIQKVEVTASRYAEVDFVKLFLKSLTDIIRSKKEQSFSFFSEPGFVTIKMIIEDNDMFTMKIALSDREINLDEKEEGANYSKFSESMYQMRTEFVPSTISAFRQFEKTQNKLDYYNENWSEVMGSRDVFEYPFEELQELHKVASDIRVK
jgi:hypothetical protein